MRRYLKGKACLALGGLILASAVVACGRPGSSAAPGLAASPQVSSLAGRVPDAAPSAPATADANPTPGPAGTGTRRSGGAAASASHHPALLPEGLYVDAPDGTAHYVLALARTGDAAIRGSVTYLYQDGRTTTIGQYTGELAQDGQLTVVFAHGQTLVGSYGSRHLTLAGCASILGHARQRSGCQFEYHGHVP